MNLTNIINKLYTSKWMMDKFSLHSFRHYVANIHDLRAGGVRGMLFGDPVLIQKNEQSPAQTLDTTPEPQGDIMVIGVSGVLVKGASEEEQELLGLTDIDPISYALDGAASDPNVSSIVLAFSSPGGETTGIEELGRKIKTIDETIKPCFVWTETQMCSAAFWLGSQGRYIGMTPTATVASCGVYMLVLDETEKLKKEGTKIIPFSSGKFKMMGHEFHNLTKEEEDILQADVEQQHTKFKNVIMAKRPQVNLESLEGLSYEGEKALELGLVDCVVDDFNGFLQQLANNNRTFNR